jgi:hypothetical protein
LSKKVRYQVRRVSPLPEYQARSIFLKPIRENGVHPGLQVICPDRSGMDWLDVGSTVMIPKGFFRRRDVKELETDAMEFLYFGMTDFHYFRLGKVLMQYNGRTRVRRRNQKPKKEPTYNVFLEEAELV